MSRSKRFFGNWKMNGSFTQADTFFSELFELAPNFDLSGTDLIGIAPATCYLDYVRTKMATGNIETLKLGAQDGSNADDNTGAYTGQLSMPMYGDCGASYIIIGQCEVREYCGFSNNEFNYRVRMAVGQGLKAIYCVGENLEQYNASESATVITQQLNEGLAGMATEQVINSVMIVYEPVWTIGTGKTCDANTVEERCVLIRSVVEQSYGIEASDKIHILYGGSVKASNAGELGHLPNVDGFLIGGASLKPEQFLTIIEDATIR